MGRCRWDLHDSGYDEWQALVSTVMNLLLPQEATS